MKHLISLTDFIDLVAYSTILLIICSLESIFFSSSDFFVELDVWIVPLVFYFLHRRAFTSIVLIILSSFIISGFSGVPIFQILLSLLAAFIFVLVFKSRSFVKGSAYLYLTTMFSIIVFYLLVLSTSYIFYYLASFNDLVLLTVITLISPGFAFIIEPGLKLVDGLVGITYPFGFEA